jgi:hypothetical protein
MQRCRPPIALGVRLGRGQSDQIDYQAIASLALEALAVTRRASTIKVGQHFLSAAGVAPIRAE